MIDIDKVCEGIDYKIISHQTIDGAWLVEILRGPYKNYTIFYNDIEINGTTGTMSFAYIAVDEHQYERRDHLIDRYAGDILEDIIRTQIANGGIEFYGKDSDQ